MVFHTSNVPMGGIVLGAKKTLPLWILWSQGGRYRGELYRRGRVFRALALNCSSLITGGPFFVVGVFMVGVGGSGSGDERAIKLINR